MFYLHWTTHPSPGSLQVGSEKKLQVLTQLAHQRHEMVSLRIKESPSQILEISNVVKKIVAKDRKGNPRYLVCRHLLNCTFICIKCLSFAFFIVSLPTC